MHQIPLSPKAQQTHQKLPLTYLLENTIIMHLLQLNSTVQLGVSALPCGRTKLNRRLLMELQV